MHRGILTRPLALAVALLLTTGGLLAAAAAFVDPLDAVPAKVLRRITASPTIGVARAGDRIVAVGIRGMIVVSDDSGKTWTQANVPVSADLLDVYFPTPQDGWAVGGDGVVLHTKDGGNHWEKQLDGRATKKLLTEHFQAHADDPGIARWQRDTERAYAAGPEQNLLSVWFEDAQHGFVAGTFGLLLETRDGGVTWASWMEKVDVGDLTTHYFSIRNTRQGLMIGTERGRIYRFDADKQRFVAMPTGYDGSFFTLVDAGSAVLAAGLLGTVYRLPEATGKWERVESGVLANFSGGTSLPDGGALLTTQAGQLLMTRDGGDHFTPVPVERPMSFTGVAVAGTGSAVVVGLDGIRTASLR